MLEIAKIIGFHGINGELKVAYNDRLYRNLSMSKFFYLQKSNKAVIEVEIEYYKVHKTNILVKLISYDTKTDAEMLKNGILLQEENKLAPLEPEEYFIKDIIGMTVYDESDIELGIVNDVLTDKASNDLIEIKTLDNQIKLIPFVEELVPVVSISYKKLVVNSKQGII